MLIFSSPPRFGHCLMSIIKARLNSTCSSFGSQEASLRLCRSCRPTLRRQDPGSGVCSRSHMARDLTLTAGSVCS